jgi:hypothetical protein
VAIGAQRGTLTRQYQIGDLVISASAVSRGMTPAQAQDVLDEIATPHAGLARRLFAFGPSGLVEDAMISACRRGEGFAPILVWVALLLGDHRIAEAVENHLTDASGRLDPDRFNAEALALALDRMGVGTHPEKAASNILRYFEAAGLVRARRYGSTVIGIDRLYPAGDAVPWVLMLVNQRLPYIEGEDVVPSYRQLDFALERGVNRWLGMSADDFETAAMGRAVDLIDSPPPEEVIDSSERGLDGFKPKSDSDYQVTIDRTTFTKSRIHETLVNDYAEWAAAQGFETGSPHPVDLTLRYGDTLWVVEAKVLYKGNATDAVRATIGQLFTYRFMHYRDENPPLVGLFSESIGDAYVTLLESLEIITVWRSRDTWAGSSLALELGMADPGGAAV